MAKPTKGHGKRDLDCKFYNDCLDLAGLKNWKSWNCESCDFFNAVFGKIKGRVNMAEEDEKVENTRICSDCNKNHTISPKHSLCASCMAKRSNVAGRKHKKPTQSMDRPETVDSGANIELVLKLGKYSGLLDELTKLAEEEVRSIEEQVIWILKRYIKDKGVTKSV